MNSEVIPLLMWICILLYKFCRKLNGGPSIPAALTLHANNNKNNSGSNNTPMRWWSVQQQQPQRPNGLWKGDQVELVSISQTMPSGIAATFAEAGLLGLCMLSLDLVLHIIVIFIVVVIVIVIHYSSSPYPNIYF